MSGKQIASKVMYANDLKRWTIDYTGYLGTGVTLTSVTPTVDSSYSTVSSYALNSAATACKVFIQAGAVAETFNISLAVVTSDGESFTDTVQIIVEA